MDNPLNTQKNRLAYFIVGLTAFLALLTYDILSYRTISVKENAIVWALIVVSVILIIYSIIDLIFSAIIKVGNKTQTHNNDDENKIVCTHPAKDNLPQFDDIKAKEAPDDLKKKIEAVLSYGAENDMTEASAALVYILTVESKGRYIKEDVNNVTLWGVLSNEWGSKYQLKSYSTVQGKARTLTTNADSEYNKSLINQIKEILNN